MINFLEINLHMITLFLMRHTLLHVPLPKLYPYLWSSHIQSIKNYYSSNKTKQEEVLTA